MSGGGSQDTTSTTTYQMSPEQRQLFRYALPFMQQFAEHPPTVEQRSGISPFDPLQRTGQRMALGAVPAQQRLASAAGAGNEFLTSGRVLSPDSNPYLRQYMSAAAQPITDQLLQQTLPALRAGYSSNAANFGSSRQQIGQGLATTGAARAVGETEANIANRGYESGLDAMTKGMSLAPAISQLQLSPAQTTSAVGDVRRSMSQALLSEILARRREEQYLPASIGKELLSMLQGIPGGSMQTQTQMPQPSPFSQVLGGASLFTGLIPLLFM